MCTGSSNTLRMCDPTVKFLELPADALKLVEIVQSAICKAPNVVRPSKTRFSTWNSDRGMG